MSDDGLTAMQRLRERLKDAGLVQYNITVVLPIAHRDFVRRNAMQSELHDLVKSRIRKSFARKHVEEKMENGS